MSKGEYQEYGAGMRTRQIVVPLHFASESRNDLERIMKSQTCKLNWMVWKYILPHNLTIKSACVFVWWEVKQTDANSVSSNNKVSHRLRAIIKRDLNSTYSQIPQWHKSFSKLNNPLGDLCLECRLKSGPPDTLRPICHRNQRRTISLHYFTSQAITSAPASILEFAKLGGVGYLYWCKTSVFRWLLTPSAAPSSSSTLQQLNPIRIPATISRSSAPCL